jgi:hypothetical protein
MGDESDCQQPTLARRRSFHCERDMGDESDAARFWQGYQQPTLTRRRSI